MTYNHYNTDARSRNTIELVQLECVNERVYSQHPVHSTDVPLFLKEHLPSASPFLAHIA
jgi:hypothetical protein